MLKHLHINNFTLIDELDIVFHPGFSVITGETGAGKSIIIGAVGLLMGERADVKSIKAGRQKCVVEAIFTIDDDNRDVVAEFLAQNELDNDTEECIIRREISTTGKSRAFVNDTPVNVSTIRNLSAKLLDIHSQHQNLMLNEEDFQLNVIDVFAGNGKLLADYSATHRECVKAQRALEELKTNAKRNADSADFLRFQQHELTEAALNEGEKEELERQSEMMTHAEEIKSGLFFSDETLCNDERGVVIQLSNALDKLQEIEPVYPAATTLRTRIEGCYIELKDLARDINSMVEDIDFDPNKLQEINSRLDQIYSLEKKYHVDSVAELIQKLDEINAALSQIDNFDEELEAAQRLVGDLSAARKQKAEKLTAARRKAAQAVETELSARLAGLGLPNVRIKVEVTAAENYSPKGGDNVVFMFSSNAGIPLQPVSRVASGGEISRVMLSLKAMMSHAANLPTIIFDEIDTGVSGRIAEKMGHIMAEMGRDNHQVICITHLPQIAAVGKHHYKVAKNETADSTNSTMTMLSEDDRVVEIAQMLSGSDITKAAIDNAKALLNTKR